MKMIYLCNPRANTECRKDSCQKECFFTTKKEYALTPDGLYYCETAIPIDWLKELQVRYLKAGCNMSVCVVNEILNLWEKENEGCLK